LLTLIALPVFAQETAEETTPMPEPEEKATPMPEPPADPAPANPAPAEPAAEKPTPQVVYAILAPQSAQEPEEDNSYTKLRRMPKSLSPVDGQAPPFGYVEVTRRKMGMAIGGSVLFGISYLLCVALSPLDRALLIPIAGPTIAGFKFDSSIDDDYQEDEYDYYYNGYNSYEDARDAARDKEYATRLYGIVCSLAQTAGVALFIGGMLSKKKLWLRQDIAGVKFQFTPTVVGQGDAGLGIVGTF
jgi:hypothetical protein